MHKPSTREWEIGKDAYGRLVRLRHSQTYDGKSVWAIQSLPYNQRDEGEDIAGLSLENLRLIGAIAQGEKP